MGATVIGTGMFALSFLPEEIFSMYGKVIQMESTSANLSFVNAFRSS